jgi:DNA polymerase III subunit epsilon
MKYGLFYDTETTGLPLWGEPSESEGQPDIVQLAAKLVNLENFRVLCAMSTIVKPSGWVIPTDTIEVHGIDNHTANELGVYETNALEQFCGLYEKCDLLIAHNISFDDRIIRIAMKRFAEEYWPDKFKEKPRFCTAKESTQILKLPPTARMRGGFKKPKLSEAYSFFTNKNLMGAHDALVDVDGCIEVYKGIQSFLNPNLQDLI